MICTFPFYLFKKFLIIHIFVRWALIWNIIYDFLLGVQSKRKFIWSDNLKRDLAKLNRFLAYGTELIQYVGEQNKSLGAWLPPDPKEPVRLFKVKTLKCVERLWAASSRHDTQVWTQVLLFSLSLI